MHTNTSLIVEVILGAASILVAFVAYRLAARVQKEQNNAIKVQVDAAAYKRATDIYESSMKELRQQVIDLQSEVDRLRRSNRTLEDRIGHLEADVDARVQSRLAGLEKREPGGAVAGDVEARLRGLEQREPRPGKEGERA